MENKEYKQRAKELVKEMSLEEKAGLCSGETCWEIKSIERLKLEPVCIMDGPHGLRKQIGSTDNLGLGVSEPAVCFPTASALACCFDRDLVREVGTAIGEECISAGVSGILGPGINMKRSPLCGRNFEYYSEDPILAGELAAAFIQGAENTGTATSLKHFAVNNQERRRMTVNAVVDERTLREIYLRAFEIAVKKGKPSTIMCSYNKINGTYASENAYLLDQILRKEWNYEGMSVSDWGAVHTRVEGIEAGLDLEMPGNRGINDRKVVQAVKEGRLSIEALNQSAERVTEFILKSMDRKKNQNCDYEGHHILARKAARESMILLKNEDAILPLGQKASVAVLGEFARNPRIQGAGSSKINPIQVDNPLEYMKQSGLSITFSQGYELKEEQKEANRKDAKKQKGTQNQKLREEAVATIQKKDRVIIFAGLPEGYESEGFDRKNLMLPENQNLLIEEICKVHAHVVVVLIGGAPVFLPWRDKVQGILLAYLGGEGMGQAVADILIGKESPSGKLAETWPLSVEDTPCFGNFPGEGHRVVYEEGIYIGYRHYDKTQKAVQYPFGYGLSYTSFSYQDLNVRQQGEQIHLCFTITNTGSITAKEIILFFVRNPEGVVHRPVRELRDFVKVEIKAGETIPIEHLLDSSEWGYYNRLEKRFMTPTGIYEIEIGVSCADPRLVARVSVSGEIEQEPSDIENMPEVEEERIPARPYLLEDSLEDVKHTMVAKLILFFAKYMMKKETKNDKEQMGMMMAAILEMPLYALVTSGGGMISESMMEGILLMLNGKYAKGVWKLIRK